MQMKKIVRDDGKESYYVDGKRVVKNVWDRINMTRATHACATQWCRKKIKRTLVQWMLGYPVVYVLCRR